MPDDDSGRHYSPGEEKMIDKASSEYSRQLEAQIKRHICKCGADVWIVWVKGEYHIKCNKCGLDPQLIKPKSYLELWKMGIPIDPHIEQVYARQEAQGKIKRKVSKEELPF